MREKWLCVMTIGRDTAQPWGIENLASKLRLTSSLVDNLNPENLDVGCYLSICCRRT